MTIGYAARQAAAGLIVGASAVIYALSYGALLFSGPMAPVVGYAITVTLITAAIGALLGAVSEGKSFVPGPDSNTITVLASIVAAIAAANIQGAASPEDMLHLAIAVSAVTALLCGGAFYLVARANLSQLVRYIPFSVMAGFLAATGWLIASGALNIIAGLPLTFMGLERFLADPLRPELGCGLFVAGVLYILAPRVSGAVLIPGVMLAATLAVNLFLRSDLCGGGTCEPQRWLFTGLTGLPWLPPWELALESWDLEFLLNNLPAMLVVAFVGLVTVLLSVASLELNMRREFDLNRVLKQHALASSLSAAVGGFSPILSIGRSMLSYQLGGSTLSGVIAAGVCVATLFGAGDLIAYVPKPALGGLVLFLGLGMLKQWLWEPWRTASRIEVAQILLILGLVANFGFLVGFSAGLLISCMVFIVTYSRIPITSVATNLALFTSSVARPEDETKVLREQGDRTLLYRLRGYVFFGSASGIDGVFRTMDPKVEAVVIDFSSVSGIDSAAVGVFQRMLRRHHDRATVFHLVYGARTEASVRAIARGGAGGRVHCFAGLDQAVETAEENVIAKTGVARRSATALQFLENETEREIFLRHCEQRSVRAGEALCHEDDRSEEIFFLERGALEVLKRSGAAVTLRLAKLHAGAMAGEIAFYTGEARTASIVALSDSMVYVLRRDALNRLRVAHPELAMRFDHMVIQKISHALARTNKLLATFR